MILIAIDQKMNNKLETDNRYYLLHGPIFYSFK